MNLLFTVRVAPSLTRKFGNTYLVGTIKFDVFTSMRDYPLWDDNLIALRSSIGARRETKRQSRTRDGGLNS
jgi:hypothetical protein